jgi:hypothetical protein
VRARVWVRVTVRVRARVISRTRVSVKARARARVGAAPPTWLKPSSSRSRPSEFIDEAPGEPCEVRVLG